MLWDNEHCIAVVAATEEREIGGGVWWLLIVSRSPRGTPCPATQPWRWWHIVYVRRIYGIIRTPAATCWVAIRWERRGVQWGMEKMGLISARKDVVLRKSKVFSFVSRIKALLWEKNQDGQLRQIIWSLTKYFTYQLSLITNPILCIVCKSNKWYLSNLWRPFISGLFHICVIDSQAFHIT